MKIYLTVLVAGLLCIPPNLKAQTSLTAQASLPRNKDEVIRQQVSFCAPGDTGRAIVWDFRDMTFLDAVQRAAYKGKLDSILCMHQNRTAYKYKLSGDTLMFLGYENSTTKMYFESPVPVLRYPFSYGDTIASPFTGRGGYSHTLSLRTYGYVRTSADAYGMMLLPGSDTLRNVVRVHRKENLGQQISTSDIPVEKNDSLPVSRSIRKKLDSDSVTWTVDTYQWYLPGYRYPVLETVENTISRKEVSSRHFYVSTLFSSEEQVLLKPDPVNEEIREQLYFAENALPPKGDPGSSSGQSGKNTVSYRINPSNNTATVYYNLNQSAKVEILLAGVSGIVFYHETPQNKTPGYYVSDIDYTRFPENEFILTAIVGDKRESWKIKRN